MKTMAAGKFKAQCLALLDEVKTKREPVLVTKHGEPWAKLVPLDAEADPLAAFRFPGTIEIVGDIMAPLYSDAENEEFFERSADQLK
jgi:prevent-host-death family protein